MRISDWSSDVCSSDLCHQHDDRGNSTPERALSEYVPHTGHFLGSSGSHFYHDGLHDDQHQRQQHEEGEQSKIEIGVPPAVIFDQCGAHIGNDRATDRAASERDTQSEAAPVFKCTSDQADRDQLASEYHRNREYEKKYQIDAP